MSKKLSKKAKKSNVTKLAAKTKPTTKTKPTVKPKTKKRTSIKNSDQMVKNVFLNNNKYAFELLTLIFPKTFMNEVDKKSLELKPDTFVENSVETRADMIFSFSVRNIAFKVFVLIEHKSNQDKEVPYQLLSYMTSVYKRHNKEGCVVVPVVLYHGESHNWNAPLNFHGCLGLDKVPNGEFLQEHVINFKYKLLNLHDLDVLKLVGKLTIAPFLATLRTSHKKDEKKIDKEIEELFIKAANDPLSDNRYREAMKLVVDPFVRFHGEESYDKLINFEKQHIKREERVMSEYKTYFEEKAEKAAKGAAREAAREARKIALKENNEKIIRTMLGKEMDVREISNLVGVPTATVKKLKKDVK